MSDLSKFIVVGDGEIVAEAETIDVAKKHAKDGVQELAAESDSGQVIFGVYQLVSLAKAVVTVEFDSRA